MRNNSFRYSFRVSGPERKVVASVIAAALFTEASYAGAPSFSHQAGGWRIDREGIVTSPETPVEQRQSLKTVLEALKTAGATAEGNGTVMFSLEGHNGNTLRNVTNLIWSKQPLIQKSLSREENIVPASLVEVINSVPIDTLEDFAKVVNDGIEAGTIIGESDVDFDLTDQTISYSFFNASLDADEVEAFNSLCWRLSEQAKLQKFSSTKRRESSNECYSMRVFLLKLGFIGDEFKTARKTLLARMEGSSAFKKPEVQQAAEAKRKARVLTERSENV